MERDPQAALGRPCLRPRAPGPHSRFILPPDAGRPDGKPCRPVFPAPLHALGLRGMPRCLRMEPGAMALFRRLSRGSRLQGRRVCMEAIHRRFPDRDCRGPRRSSDEQGRQARPAPEPLCSCGHPAGPGGVLQQDAGTASRRGQHNHPCPLPEVARIRLSGQRPGALLSRSTAQAGQQPQDHPLE